MFYFPSKDMDALRRNITAIIANRGTQDEWNSEFMQLLIGDNDTTAQVRQAYNEGLLGPAYRITVNATSQRYAEILWSGLIAVLFGKFTTPDNTLRIYDRLVDDFTLNRIYRLDEDGGDIGIIRRYSDLLDANPNNPQDFRRMLDSFLIGDIQLDLTTRNESFFPSIVQMAQNTQMTSRWTPEDTAVNANTVVVGNQSSAMDDIDNPFIQVTPTGNRLTEGLIVNRPVAGVTEVTNFAPDVRRRFVTIPAASATIPAINVIEEEDTKLEAILDNLSEEFPRETAEYLLNKPSLILAYDKILEGSQSEEFALNAVEGMLEEVLTARVGVETATQVEATFIRGYRSPRERVRAMNDIYQIAVNGRSQDLAQRLTQERINISSMTHDEIAEAMGLEVTCRADMQHCRALLETVLEYGEDRGYVVRTRQGHIAAVDPSYLVSAAASMAREDEIPLVSEAIASDIERQCQEKNILLDEGARANFITLISGDLERRNVNQSSADYIRAVIVRDGFEEAISLPATLSRATLQSIVNEIQQDAADLSAVLRVERAVDVAVVNRDEMIQRIQIDPAYRDNLLKLQQNPQVVIEDAIRRYHSVGPNRRDRIMEDRDAEKRLVHSIRHDFLNESALPRNLARAEFDRLDESGQLAETLISYVRNEGTFATSPAIPR